MNNIQALSCAAFFALGICMMVGCKSNHANKQEELLDVQVELDELDLYVVDRSANNAIRSEIAKIMKTDPTTLDEIREEITLSVNTGIAAYSGWVFKRYYPGTRWSVLNAKGEIKGSFYGGDVDVIRGKSPKTQQKFVGSVRIKSLLDGLSKQEFGIEDGMLYLGGYNISSSINDRDVHPLIAAGESAVFQLVKRVKISDTPLKELVILSTIENIRGIDWCERLFQKGGFPALQVYAYKMLILSRYGIFPKSEKINIASAEGSAEYVDPVEVVLRGCSDFAGLDFPEAPDSNARIEYFPDDDILFISQRPYRFGVAIWLSTKHLRTDKVQVCFNAMLKESGTSEAIECGSAPFSVPVNTQSACEARDAFRNRIQVLVASQSDKQKE